MQNSIQEKQNEIKNIEAIAVCKFPENKSVKAWNIFLFKDFLYLLKMKLQKKNWKAIVKYHPMLMGFFTAGSCYYGSIKPSKQLLPQGSNIHKT